MQAQGLAERRILLGVTGGIAAYKAAYLVRRLREQGAQVRVVMSAAAQAFITPMTLQALSAHPVRSDLLDPQAEAGMGHIELARWAEQVLVAPATADFMARLSHGLADDLLSTLCLATAAPIALAPAMNQLMWRNAATQANAALLRQRGVQLLGPDEGDQACGDVGPGRMWEPDALVRALLERNPEAGLLAGVKVLLTAGPTREPIDPVRYISNRSSGKMGYALAQALSRQGAEVCLVSGPVRLPAPPDVRLIQVESALQMRQAVMARAAENDIFVASAAVADYRMDAVAEEKIKKSAQSMTLKLVKNPDILAEVAALERGPFTMGFAAETQRLREYALDKMQRKGLDMIAANQVGGDEGGFDSERNALVVFWPGGEQAFAMTSKTSLAEQLAPLLSRRYRDWRAQNPAPMAAQQQL
jgi:phosphopantothenoylcysteine decarboxylase/phosphopantothenate--cysteine ligase